MMDGGAARWLPLSILGGSQIMSQTGRRLLLLLAQSISLIICVLYVDSFYTQQILPDKQVEDYYQQTNCYLINKGLAVKGRVIKKYRADFWVSYNVDNVHYTQPVYGNGLDSSYSTNRAGEESTLQQFNVGGSYPCWYNPDDPSQSVLILRHNWLATFPLMIPSAIFLIIFYYLVINLICLGVDRREQAKEKRK